MAAVVVVIEQPLQVAKLPLQPTIPVEQVLPEVRRVMALRAVTVQQAPQAVMVVQVVQVV